MTIVAIHKKYLHINKQAKNNDFSILAYPGQSGINVAHSIPKHYGYLQWKNNEPQGQPSEQLRKSKKRQTARLPALHPRRLCFRRHRVQLLSLVAVLIGNS